MLPQWHVKDPSHSAKSAGGRLHLNTHTPLTQRSRSGLTMLLSRHCVGTYPETSSHATCQGTFGHSLHFKRERERERERESESGRGVNGRTFPGVLSGEEEATTTTTTSFQLCIIHKEKRACSKTETCRTHCPSRVVPNKVRGTRKCFTSFRVVWVCQPKVVSDADGDYHLITRCFFCVNIGLIASHHYVAVVTV